MADQKYTGIILLAAGSSERLGINKLEILFKGRTLLENAVLSASKSLANSIVVVSGFNEVPHEYLVNDSVHIIQNNQWKNGIGSSIKCGLKFLMGLDQPPGSVIISVCDQPYLTTSVFDQLILAYRAGHHRIIASEYMGTMGVPVLYDQSFFRELLSISDQQGAKKQLLETNKEAIFTVPFINGHIDIDTLEDYHQLKEKMR